METYTFAEAAEATGLTKKALRNRVYRGQIRAVLRDGVRRIPRSELERVGLALDEGETLDEAQERHETAGGIARPGVVSELLDRLERQAGELVELRALTREAESLQAERAELERALYEERAKVTELEAKLAETQQPRRRWWSRRTPALDRQVRAA